VDDSNLRDASCPYNEAICRWDQLAMPPQRSIFCFMGDTYASDIHVVAATKDGQTQFWAAALPLHEVLAQVALEVGDGWALTVTTKRLTVQKAAALNMRSNSIRRIE
jgi:hypothetical protein